MLDDRYAAAPRRRTAPRGALLIIAVLLVTTGLWAGARLTDTNNAAVVTAGPPASPLTVNLIQVLEPSKYTQTRPKVAKDVSKTVPATTARINPHPDQQPEPAPRIEWKTHTVSRGDTLGEIFRRFSIDLGLARDLVQHDTGSMLKKLMPDHEIRFGFNTNDELVRLRYELNRTDELLAHFDGDDPLRVTQRKIPTEIREHSVSQSIGSSLFVSASKAGLSDRLIMELVSIFGWDVDFALDVQPGDRFSILYEEMFRHGESVGTGDIVAAEFVNNGRIYHAVRHIDDEGQKRYFDLDGNSLRGAFLRTPMRVSRITSGFSKRRYHPVLKKWRAHRGVDYGAPTGTPVLATADGRVETAGRKGGYGNTVVLKHGGQYSTLYAHLSRFKKGLRSGSRVQQGEVIGYVGSTGLVTGPHLHYEFRVNGNHRNPLTYDTPKAQPIAERYRDGFLAMARDRIEQITEFRGEQLASR